MKLIGTGAAYVVSSRLEVGCVRAGPTSQLVHWKRWDTGIQPVAVARDAIRRVGRSHEVQSDKSTVVTVLSDEARADRADIATITHIKPIINLGCVRALAKRHCRCVK